MLFSLYINTDDELIEQLKQRGTYNPELMAYNTEGIMRFLRKHYSGDANPHEEARNEGLTPEQEQETVR